MTVFQLKAPAVKSADLYTKTLYGVALLNGHISTQKQQPIYLWPGTLKPSLQEREVWDQLSLRAFFLKSESGFFACCHPLLCFDLIMNLWWGQLR